MIEIVAIGRIKEKAMTSLIDEYLKRLKPIHQVVITELNNSNRKDTEVAGIIEDESKKILEKIDGRDHVVLLDLRGKDLNSEDMSSKIMGEIDASKKIVFVIGGSHGVSEEVRNRANFRWKISNLTFPHQLVRVMLCEQVYRMFMIARNHPYHK